MTAHHSCVVRVDEFLRIVARTLARQFMREVEKTCVPFQFALSTRAGIDCVGQAVRGATDLDPRMTVLSIDGIAAYEILEVESLRCLLPFVRSAYSQPSGRGRTRGPTHATFSWV